MESHAVGQEREEQARDDHREHQATHRELKRPQGPPSDLDAKRDEREVDSHTSALTSTLSVAPRGFAAIRENFAAHPSYCCHRPPQGAIGRERIRGASGQLWSGWGESNGPIMIWAKAGGAWAKGSLGLDPRRSRRQDCPTSSILSAA